MKLSEHIKWAISRCDETNPSKIRKYLIDEYGIEITLAEIRSIQQELISEYNIRKDLKESISKYGTVEEYGEVGEDFHIKITDGFSTNANSTFELIRLIDAAIGKQYSIVKKLVTDDNHFDYILAKAKN